MQVSYLEIYNEHVFDLLGGTPNAVQMYEEAGGAVSWEGSHVQQVLSEQSALEYFFLVRNAVALSKESFLSGIASLASQGQCDLV